MYKHNICTYRDGNCNARMLEFERLTISRVPVFEHLSGARVQVLERLSTRDLEFDIGISSKIART